MNDSRPRAHTHVCGQLDKHIDVNSVVVVVGIIVAVAVLPLLCSLIVAIADL